MFARASWGSFRSPSAPQEGVWRWGEHLCTLKHSEACLEGNPISENCKVAFLKQNRLRVILRVQVKGKLSSQLRGRPKHSVLIQEEEASLP